jgi:transcription termination factor Rho
LNAPENRIEHLPEINAAYKGLQKRKKQKKRVIKEAYVRTENDLKEGTSIEFERVLDLDGEAFEFYKMEDSKYENNEND